MNVLRPITFVLLFFLMPQILFTQTYSVGGLIHDGKEPAIGAIVNVLGTDSSYIKGAATGIDGKFLIAGLAPQTYLLKVSLFGFKDLYRTIQLNQNLELGTLNMKQDLKQLEEVQIKTEAIAATQNGDTSSFNAAAFKTNRDATAEELVAKMPGVTMQDGKVQAQGEDVQQVLVDGQRFFGDDAAAVLKNLPAEVIDKVQVFDRKSEQAQFTGFDDGNTQKTINIVTKVEFRNGTFGRTYAGYGTDERYRAGGVVNRFKDKQRITLMVMSNNVNEQNFSSEDLVGVSAGSNRGGAQGGRGRRGGFGDNSGNFLVNMQDGISSTNAVGLNYTDVWAENTTINASYLFNQTFNRSESELRRQYVVGANSGLIYEELSAARTDNYNHRLNMRIETKLDSMNSLLFRPRLSIQNNAGTSAFSGNNSSAEGILSTITNNFNSQLQGINIQVPMQYRHRFLKKGRTISFELEPEYNRTGGENALQTSNNFLSDTLNTNSLDQRSLLKKDGYGGEFEITYTEPAGRNGAISLNYESNLMMSSSEKNTYNFDPAVNNYSLRDTLLSNSFENRYLTHAAGPGYRLSSNKLIAGAWVMYQRAELSRNELFPGSSSDTRVFESAISRIFVRYNFSPKKTLRVFFRSSNDAPRIEQMQEVVNNRNNLQLTTGNAGLAQTNQRRFVIRYSEANTEKLTSLFLLFGGSHTDNYIGNSTIVAENDTVVYNGITLNKGSQITRPVNLNGQYSLRVFVNYTFPVKFLKSNLNLNTSLNHNHTPALVNNKVNFSDNSNAGVGFVLSSNISERFDFTISSSPSYNFVRNSLQQNLNTSYYFHNSKVRLSCMPTEFLQLQAEYSNLIYNGLTGGFNQNINLLNGSVAYKFSKDRNAELRIYVFDILRQNNSITREVTETYIDDRETTLLQQYYMLSFTWNFKRFGG